ncbi:MAG: 50S ribosomal protein L29 [Nanohaloarchaea archaeon]|nr:50S ribosomal protein L29 [Candidatus Nanohaloarchaea archaeon]
MAILKADEIRDMSEDEARERLNDLKKEIVEEKGQIETGGFAEDPGRIKEMRRTIARIKTVLNEKE